MIDDYRDTNAYENLAFNSFLTKTFGIMGLGLIITALVSFLSVYSLYNGGLFYKIFVSSYRVFWILAIAQLFIALYLTAKINDISISTAWILFILYTALTGVSFGILPIIYGVQTMFLAFGFSAVLFISMAIIGYTTKADLSKFSSLLSAGLISIIIASIVSIFLKLDGLNLIISYIGIFVFLGLTAYDIQKIKHNYYYIYDEDSSNKYSIVSAFVLYLDFINLFMYALRILGSRRNRK